MQRTFRAAQKFLNHDAPAGVAEPTLVHQFIDCRSCGGDVRGNNHAFAERETVRLNDDWKRKVFAVMQRLFAVGKRARLRSGNFFRAHQFLGENLRRFEARSRFGRTKNAQFLRHEKIDNSQRQRIIRADYG